jgi:hypothetical protein
MSTKAQWFNNLATLDSKRKNPVYFFADRVFEKLYYFFQQSFLARFMPELR